MKENLLSSTNFVKMKKTPETLSQTQNQGRRYSSHFYRTIEADYDEINEDFEIQVSAEDNMFRNENFLM